MSLTANPVAVLANAMGGRIADVYGAGGGGWRPPLVWDAQTARQLPAVAKALGVYSGTIKQMPIDDYRGTEVLPRPALLDRPEPLRGRGNFVQVSVEDYLLHGNAVCAVTVRNAEGWPAAVQWLPAVWTSVLPATQSTSGEVEYWYQGVRLPTVDVVHVRRGADRYCPERGVGVLEEHLGSFDRFALEEDYERQSLSASGVPSVAVITPNPSLDQEESDDAKARWMAKFAGPAREPVILPAGTEVKPLAWSPTDTQLAEARKLSLVDAANIFNLDAYWLNGATTSLTYKNIRDLFAQLLVSSIEGVLTDFEDEWSYRWLPRGRYLRFGRRQLTADDLPTTADFLVKLVGAGIIDAAQAQQYLELPTVGNQEPIPLDTNPPPPAVEIPQGGGT